MDSAFIEQLLLRLRTRWHCSQPVGCDEAAIRELEQALQTPLPVTYHWFLRTCGLSAGELLVGYHWSIDSRASRNQEFQTCLAEEGFEAPGQAFVFLDYLGDYFWYFCGSAADPQVMLFDHDRFHDTGFRLTQFLLQWEQLDA